MERADGPFGRHPHAIGDIKLRVRPDRTPLHKRVAGVIGLGLFVLGFALLGGMLVPFVAWIFTATLLPNVLTWLLILVGLSGGAWLIRFISEDWD
jgi:hypothetical protein